jgi:hypothetical protein
MYSSTKGSTKNQGVHTLLTPRFGFLPNQQFTKWRPRSFPLEFLKSGLEPSSLAAASDGDSAPCEDMEQSKDMTQLEDTSEITLVKLLNSIVYPCDPVFPI